MIANPRQLHYLSNITNEDVTKLELPEGAKIISNSEVDAFTTCERKHLFSFGWNKEARHPNHSLSLGIAGHEVIAVFYRAVKNGATKKEAEQVAMQYLSKLYLNQSYEPDTLNLLAILFRRYVQYETLSTTCKILCVEEDFYMPISSDYWYGMRLDLLVHVMVGQHRGQIMLVDNKFTYDFFSPKDLKLNPQMPKYVPAVRLSGYPVHQAYLNQIRWRFSAKTILFKNKLDEDLFRMSSTDITQPRIRSAIKQQMIFSERILERRALPMELQIEESQPSLNKMVCVNCSFTDPCIMMQEEKDVREILEVNYQDRTYGYSKVENNGQ